MDKKLPNNIEKLTKVSPLLNDEIVEKDYTKGIELQPETIQEQPKEAPPQPTEQQQQQPPPPTEEPKKVVEDYTIDPDAAKMKDETKGFAFDQFQAEGGEAPPEGATPGFTPGGDDAGATATDDYKLPEASAKEFAEMITHAFSIYVPQFSYTFVKIDLNNIKFHVEQGNIRPEFESVFRECNRNTEKALEFTHEEMVMFQNSLQKYLEYKNVSYANPETAFWANVAILGTKQIYVLNKLMKENQKLVYDTITESNPDYKVKKEKKKEPEPPEEPEETTES